MGPKQEVHILKCLIVSLVLRFAMLFDLSIVPKATFLCFICAQVCI
jgi:hypothetical protein